MLTQFRRTWGIAFAVAIAAGLGISSGPATADLLTEIKERGEFIVGTEARFPPFEFVKDGEIVGYSTDIMSHISANSAEVARSDERSESTSAA